MKGTKLRDLFIYISRLWVINTVTLNICTASGTDGTGTSGTPVYNMAPQGSQPQNVQQQMQIPPHIQHMLVPQANFSPVNFNSFKFH